MKAIVERILKVPPERRDVYVILSASFLLLLVYRYFGSASNFYQYFPQVKTDPLAEYYAYIFQFGAFFVLMFVLPLLYNAFFMKSSLRDLGFGLGDIKFGAKSLLVLLPLIAGLGVIGSLNSEAIRGYYPLARLVFTHRDLLAPFEILWVLLYFVPWEFFFRGFMLFPLAKLLGNTNAILIQTIASALVHIGTPTDEAFSSIVAGLAFGYVSIRTGSFWYAFVLHVVTAVVKDVLIVVTS